MVNNFRYVLWNISSSGLRELKVDLYNEDPKKPFPTVSSLIEALGGPLLVPILEKDGISKYMARLGLSQSKSIPTIKVFLVFSCVDDTDPVEQCAGAKRRLYRRWHLHIY
jgi:hypothetical protein